MPEILACKLCENQQPLLESHILPAFVFRWLKDTSMTGHIRHAAAPNKRVQDGLKLPFLCESCETLFNKFETPFANSIFYPYSENPSKILAYREWLQRFCVSVSWRVLKYLLSRDLIGKITDEEHLQAINAELCWREFLLGERFSLGDYEQHLIPFALIDEINVDGVPNNLNRYLMRTVELDVAFGQSVSFTYSKLGPFALFGFIKKPPEKWLGTKVRSLSGKIGQRKYELPSYLFDYLMDRARNRASIDEKISEKQHAKVEATLLANLDRAAESQQIQAMLRDADIFGKSAIIRKPKK